MAGKEKRHLLGTIDGKEYYLDLVPVIESKGQMVPNPTFQKVVWRVPDIREAVEAEKGNLILSADYSQIEVKLMAHLSRDPVLIASINSGKDVHAYNATVVFGEDKHFTYEEMMEAKKVGKDHSRYAELIKLRNDIKTVTFGVPYGAGASKVQLMTGMATLEEAQRFIDNFFNTFKELKKWLEKSGDDAIKYGFSMSPRGRRRFYQSPSEEAKEEDRKRILSQTRRYAGNHPIQAGNVDMLKPAMYQIYNDLRIAGYTEDEARILFCVHDEIVMTARADLALRVDGKPGPIETIMMHRMQESYDGIIPDIVNKIDVAIGQIWEKA